MDWVRSGWANNSGIELFTNGRVKETVSTAFGDCIAWIGSNWATQCADQAWTNGWICCTDLPGQPQIEFNFGPRSFDDGSERRKRDEKDIIAILLAVANKDIL